METPSAHDVDCLSTLGDGTNVPLFRLEQLSQDDVTSSRFTATTIVSVATSQDQAPRRGCASKKWNAKKMLASILSNFEPQEPRRNDSMVAHRVESNEATPTEQEIVPPRNNNANHFSKESGSSGSSGHENVATTTPWFGRSHNEVVSSLVRFNRIHHQQGGAPIPLQLPQRSPWRRSWPSQRYSSEVVEAEFLIHLHRHRSQIYITTAYGIAAILAETGRFIGTLMVKPSLVILVCLGISGFVAAFFGTLYLSFQLRSHDQQETFLSRIAIRRNAVLQEYIVLVVVVLFGTFLILSTMSLGECPWVETLVGKVIYCHNTFGSDSFFLLTFATCACLLPVTWVTALMAFVINASLVILAMQLLTQDGLLAPENKLDDLSTSQALVVLDAGLMWGRAIFYIVFGGAMVFIVRQNERSARTEFEEVTLLVALQQEASLLHDALASQVMATMPAFVARRLLNGERIYDEVANAGVMLFSIPGFAAWTSQHGSSEVVELLNQVFCVLDNFLVRHPKVTKMQTVGDLYTVVSGLAWVQKPPHPHEVENGQLRPAQHNAIDILRFAEDVMHRLGNLRDGGNHHDTVDRTHEEPLVVLDSRSVMCTVLGSTKAYVAVGTASLVNLMRSQQASRRGLMATTSFQGILRSLSRKTTHDQVVPINSTKEPSVSRDTLTDREARQLHQLISRDSDSDHLEASATAQVARASTVGEVTDDEGDACDNDAQLQLEDCGLDFSVSYYLLFIPFFTNPLVESMYEEHRSSNVLEHNRDKTALALAAFIAFVTAMLHLVVGASLQPEERLFCCLLALSFVAALLGSLVNRDFASGLFESTTRTYVRHALYAAFLGCFIASLFFVKRPSFLVNNTVVWTLALTFVSVRRPSSRGPLIHAAQDVITINIPLWILFLHGTHDLWTHPPLTLDCLVRNINNVYTRLAPQEMIPPLSDADFHSLLVQSLYLNILVVTSVNLVIRILHERSLRESFINQVSLREMTTCLINERRLMEKYVRSIIPKYIVDRFQSFIHHSAQSDRRTRSRASGCIDPWYGAWFATAVEEQSVMIVLLPVGLVRQSACVGESNSNNNVLGQSNASGLLKSLEEAHAIIDNEVVNARGAICKVKSAGDVVIIVGSDHLEQSLRAVHLLACASAILAAFKDQTNGPKIVLNSGNAVGAVIGSDRLTFEMFGEVVSTSMELLNAMMVPGGIATERFMHVWHQSPPNSRRVQVTVESEDPDNDAPSLIPDASGLTESGLNSCSGAKHNSVIVRKRQVWKVRGSVARSVHTIDVSHSSAHDHQGIQIAKPPCDDNLPIWNDA